MLCTLVVYQGAFLSEVVRAGIVALGSGQMDAARALGHSSLGAMRFIILPQALYNMIPSIISTFVSTIKDTTLGYVINVPDLTFAASQVNNQLLTQPFQVFFILAVVYYAICWSLTHVANMARAPHHAPPRGSFRRRRAPVALGAGQNPIGAAMSTSAAQAQQLQTIHLSNVCKSYGDYPVLKNIDAEVARGEVVVICGPSGSGKSTLIRTINRLEEINSGSITLDGQNIHAAMRSEGAQPAAQPDRFRVPELQPVPAPLRGRKCGDVADPREGRGKRMSPMRRR
jgi:ABC-type multidrug transport system fused ATPase/permease subunit